MAVRLRIVTVLALLALAALPACGRMSSYNGAGPPDLPEVPNLPPPWKGDALVPGAKDDMATTLAGGAISPDETHAKDKVSKADLYWKMRAIHDAIYDGKVPEEMRKTLAETRKRLEQSEDDGHKMMMKNIMDDLDHAFEAYNDEREFKRAGVDTRKVPWGAGRVQLEARGTDNLLGFPSGDITGFRAEKEKKNQASILDYESKHHASPVSMRREALARALDRIEQVRRAMDAERIMAGDHAIGEGEKPVPGSIPSGADHFQIPPVPGQRTKILLP